MDSLLDALSVLMVLGFWFGAITFAYCLRRLEATVDRMEAATRVVATNLVFDRAEQSQVGATVDRMEAQTRIVAANLADSFKRADEL